MTVKSKSLPKRFKNIFKIKKKTLRSFFAKKEPLPLQPTEAFQKPLQPTPLRGF